MLMQENLDNKWVCPSDRQLSLRAKLNCGWSVRTSFSNSNHLMLSKDELAHIRQVISKAEAKECNEQVRVGEMIRRLELLRGRCCGDGLINCILCAEKFGKFIGESPVKCFDCKKNVCSKCSVDISIMSTSQSSQADRMPHWLCKICSESREVWKRSGAWFFRSLPKFIIPKSKDPPNRRFHQRSMLVTPDFPNAGNSSSAMYDHRESICVGRKKSSSSESSDDEIIVGRQTRQLQNLSSLDS